MLYTSIIYYTNNNFNKHKLYFNSLFHKRATYIVKNNLQQEWEIQWNKNKNFKYFNYIKLNSLFIN